MTAIAQMHKAKSAAKSGGLFARLNSIQLGPTKGPEEIKIPRRELIYILRNISTLVENGLSLPKTLHTLGQEKTLQQYSHLLETVRRKVEAGESFSKALARFPQAFTEAMVNQIKVGEQSGTLVETIRRITAQLEKAADLRGQIIKKLAYPIILMVVGSMSVTFMLLFVVPVFEETYAQSKVQLPGITRVLIAVGNFMQEYWWLAPLLGSIGILATKHIRRKPHSAAKMDRLILSLPFLGDWFTNIAVLQFMEVLGNLLEAGFTMVDALRVSANTVSNCAVRQSVESLHTAVIRGERFSREMERHADLFPPVVRQLVVIGEQTGTLPKATTDIRAHLRREIERHTNLMIGTIEPVLTISLAVAIGGILLAIYLPMFDMMGAMNPTQ